jgi:hypothetical protein
MIATKYQTKYHGKNNKITIDVIAVMMQKGLAEIHEIMGKIREDLNQKSDKADIDLVLKTKADKSDIDLVLARIKLLGDKIDENRNVQIP